MSRRKSKLPRHSKAKPAPEPSESSAGIAREGFSVLLFALGVFVAASLYSHYANHGTQLQLSGPQALVAENIMGPFGELTAVTLVKLIGWCSFVTVAWIFLFARIVWINGLPVKSGSFLSFFSTAAGALCILASTASIFSVLFGYEGGGALGSHIAFTLVSHVNEAGTILISAAVLILAMGSSTGISATKIVSFSQRIVSWCKSLLLDVGLLLRSSLKVFTGGNFIVGKLLFLGFAYVLVSCKKFIQAVLRFPSTCLSAIASIFRRKKKAVEPAEAISTPKIVVAGEEPFVLGKGKTKAKIPPAPKVAESSASDLAGQVETESVEESTGPTIISREMLKRRFAKAGTQSRRKKPRRKVSPRADFQLPSPELLVSSDGSPSTAPTEKELIENSRRLEKTLGDFRITGKVVEVQPGPVITLYQFEPAAGIKVQRIVSLADDLALSLKVGSVRVYAPVPGKGTVGIEVPNAQREMVRLRDVIGGQSETAISNSTLPLAVGKDTFGEPFVTDLARMPHLLIAGATGAGKSVCVNSLLVSLLYHFSPDEMRLIMIDPKMLELSVYEDIPHLKARVVTNPRHSKAVLWWAVEEMERRYQMMKRLKVRNLTSYNKIVAAETKKSTVKKKSKAPIDGDVIELEEKNIVATGSPEEGLRRDVDDGDSAYATSDDELSPLPYIVIVVDELADLMLTVGREIEELLTRLAQKARAAGIHLILATQRPSVNVITGLIKANFPARIAFKVASRIDSRTVLDTSGAEKLLGQGDMLFLSPGTGLKRLHSAFVSDKEVNEVVDYLKEQAPADYDEDIEAVIERFDKEEGTSLFKVDGEDDYDPLYDQAVNYVIEKGQASTSMVQRMFRIGYNRAARILETMEHEGVVGPADGSKPRQVLVPARDAV